MSSHPPAHHATRGAPTDLSVMHLRETFGERTPGDSERMRTHYAEADNELHHLLIMEELGGNSSVVDRTVAQTMAFFYYWYVVAVYLVSEQAAYHLSELIEDHAYHTYDNFLKRNAEELRQHAVPAIARSYYEEPDPFLLDLFCSRSRSLGRPRILLARDRGSRTSTMSSSTSATTSGSTGRRCASSCSTTTCLPWTSAASSSSRRHGGRTRVRYVCPSAPTTRAERRRQCRTRAPPLLSLRQSAEDATQSAVGRPG